ncbi:hypothetical protein [Paraburkholderia acidipaludis]|uniref:hypothetical protein n=1 Tax=Paraburkholderia acidipaludis TaxID=660537 RepID=UPI0012EBF891|nr:hypothetical protein [Paraburkholderia acidipaludis]
MATSVDRSASVGSPEHRLYRRLTYVELTVDPENLASRKVIESSGGLLVERFRKAAAYGGTEALRFRIAPGG